MPRLSTLQCYHELFTWEKHSASYIQSQPVAMSNPEHAYESGTRCMRCRKHMQTRLWWLASAHCLTQVQCPHFGAITCVLQKKVAHLWRVLSSRKVGRGFKFQPQAA